MKQIILITLLLTSFCSCNIIHRKFGGKDKFFEYDEIDYYYNNIDDEKLEALYRGSKTPLDSLREGVILRDIPNDISDLYFISQLEPMGYKKSIIDSSKFAAIDKIFVEKTVNDIVQGACIYVYRDILIFKENKEVVGTAKICFGCMANEIQGTNADTEYFGQNGDYERLEKLLSE